MKKLERDTLQRQCKREIEGLHGAFVAWFQGLAPKQVLEDLLKSKLQFSFSHVAPNGQFLLGRNLLLKHLDDKYACYKDRIFRIDIYNVQLLWSDEVELENNGGNDEDDGSTGNNAKSVKCLCTYEEWQSWHQPDEETGEEKLVQFGRLSTCLLEKTKRQAADDDGGDGANDQWTWVHVHETWLEADAPPKAAAGAGQEGTATAGTASVSDESGITGPMPPPRRHTKEMPSRRPTTFPPHQDDAWDGKPRLVVLVSTEDMSKEHIVHQNQTFDILQSYVDDGSILETYQKVDGKDFHQRDRRNQLFDVSGIRGKYPQFFVERRTDDGDVDVAYWGDWHKFMVSNAADTLIEDLGLEADGDGVAAENGEADGSEGSIANPFDEEADLAAETPADYEEEEEKEQGDEDGEMQEEEDGGDEESGDGLGDAEREFLHASQGILVFEDEDDGGETTQVEGGTVSALSTPEKKDDGEADGTVVDLNNTESPIPHDASSKRHLSPKIFKYAKPLKWENALVGISIAGFDIGTSQGPMGDETWFKETGETLEELAQSRNIPRPRRKICLPEMVFPTAHVAIEGHGFWLSWDALDALEEWARCHHEIAIHSRISYNGVSVMRAKDAKLWEEKRKHGDSATTQGVSSVFHYDWTFSTPFCGKVEGGVWQELDESGMRLSLLTDHTVPILFFDEIMLYEDDLHDNGQTQFSVKLRVMPTCAYVLARLWLRVDNVMVRVRETRVLIDFFGRTPQVFRDVVWRECMWGELAANKLPTDVRSWRCDGRETVEWNDLLKALPECSLPKGIPKHAILQNEDSE